jgi:hypothetical protein
VDVRPIVLINPVAPMPTIVLVSSTGSISVEILLVKPAVVDKRVALLINPASPRPTMLLVKLSELM